MSYNKSKIAGVYAIVCEVTGDRYVGSAKDVISRITKHLKDMKKGVHVNPNMQALYDTHGPDAIKCFLLLAIWDEDERFDAEQFLIDTGAFNLNIGRNARDCLPIARRARPSHKPVYRPEKIRAQRIYPRPPETWGGGCPPWLRHKR